MIIKHFGFLITLLCVYGIRSFDIDDIELNVSVDGSEITVAVWDDPDLISIFFSTELSNKCTCGYTFVAKPDNNGLITYKEDIKRTLQSDDEFRIIALFHTLTQFIRKEYDFKMDDQNNAILQDNKPCDCLISQTEMNGERVPHCSGTNILNEEFNETLINWKHDLRIRIVAVSPHQEFVAYTKYPENCKLKDGFLNITATWAPYMDPFDPKDCTSRHKDGFAKRECIKDKQGYKTVRIPVFTSVLNNKDNFSFKYGRVEIRAKFPIGDWLFPYLLLFPSNHHAEDPVVNHIRMAYGRGNEAYEDISNLDMGGSTVFGSVVIWGNSSYTEHKSSMTNIISTHMGEDFHNYTLIWKKSEIIFKIDGEKYGSITNSTVLEHINKHEHFIILGLTAGGGINFPDDNIIEEDKQFQNSEPHVVNKFRTMLKIKWEQPTLLIDYIRIYTVHEDEE